MREAGRISAMPGIILSGAAGRIEAEYHQSTVSRSAPVALLFHPHPQLGGTMDSPVVQHLFQLFVDRGFSVLRFNYRGVGRSQGEFENGPGELSDAATILDWLQEVNRHSSHFWAVGHSFGAWLGMQLLMRRPELTGFVAVSPPVTVYDFSFLAPCPSSGLIVNGTSDKVALPRDVRELALHLKSQRGITITHQEITGANHVFRNKLNELVRVLTRYLDKREREEEALMQENITPRRRVAGRRR